MEQEIKACSICNAYSRANQKEPLLSHSVPLRPRDKIGADHFTFATADYLIVVDYFSKYPEVIKVESKCTETTVEVMKTIFSRNGIPTTIIADLTVDVLKNMLNKNSPGLLKKGAAKQSRINIAWHLRWLVRTRADIGLQPSGLVRSRTDIKLRPSELVRSRTDIKLRPSAFVRTRTDFKLQTVRLVRSCKD